MTFSAELNAYCAALGCTSRELAEGSGISASTLSRYRSGKRTPNASGEPVRKLAAGIAQMAEERNIADIGTEQDVLVVLTSGLQRGTESFSRKLDSLMRMLGISNVEMSRHSNVDPSYLSRIRNGKRSPAEPRRLAESCVEVIVRHAQEKGLTGTISFMTGNDANTLEGAEAATVRWLLDEGVTEGAVGSKRDGSDADMLEMVIRFESSTGQGGTGENGFEVIKAAALSFVSGTPCVPGIVMRLVLPEECCTGDAAVRRAWLKEVAKTIASAAEA